MEEKKCSISEEGLAKISFINQFIKKLTNLGYLSSYQKFYIDGHFITNYIKILDNKTFFSDADEIDEKELIKDFLDYLLEKDILSKIQLSKIEKEIDNIFDTMIA